MGEGLETVSMKKLGIALMLTVIFTPLCFALIAGRSLAGLNVDALCELTHFWFALVLFGGLFFRTVIKYGST